MMKRFNKIGTLILDLILERSKKIAEQVTLVKTIQKKTLTFLALHIFEIKFPKFQKFFTCRQEKFKIINSTVTLLILSPYGPMLKWVMLGDRIGF